ncbi:MAG: hypothetical protein ABII82_09420 [Verrucomicrobiota bacterium]
MKVRRTRNVLLSTAALIGIVYAMPSIWMLLFQRPEDGMFMELGTGCMCGHRSRVFIKEGRLIDYSIGHSDWRELYDLTPAGEKRYALTGYRPGDAGYLEVHFSYLLMNTDHEYRLRRIWSPWRTWYEKWRYRDEVRRMRTLDEYRQMWRENEARRHSVEEPAPPEEKPSGPSLFSR